MDRIASLYDALLAALAREAAAKARAGDQAYADRLERFSSYVQDHRRSYRADGKGVRLGIALDMQDLSEEMYEKTEVYRLCIELDTAIAHA